MKLDVPEGAFGNIHLKILAPQAYWVGWSSSSSLPIDRVDAQFIKIVEQVNLGLASSFFVSKFSVSLLVLDGPDADEMIGEPHQIT